jgi:hypothetical protein
MAEADMAVDMVEADMAVDMADMAVDMADMAVVMAADMAHIQCPTQFTNPMHTQSVRSSKLKSYLDKLLNFIIFLKTLAAPAAPVAPVAPVARKTSHF